jgi:hypothetical protein
VSTQPDSTATNPAAASVSEVLEHIFEQFPHVARRVGRHEYDSCLPEVARRSTADLDRMRARVAGHLDALAAPVDADLRADLGAALKMIEEECFLITERDEGYIGPLGWLAETDVDVYLKTPYAPLDERLEALHAHLARLPSFLRQAARTVKPRLPAGERVRGIEEARARAATIEALAGRLAAEHPQLTGERFATAASQASAACEDFARAVAATAPTKGLLGPELLAASLRVTEGLDHPVADLLEEARAEVDSVAAALDATAAKLGVQHRQQAYELMTAQVGGASVLESLDAIVQRVKDFWIGQDILSVETANLLEIRRAGPSAGAAAVEFRVAGPLERVRQPHVLYVPDPSDSVTEGPAVFRRQYLNDPMLEVIAVHETFAGHYVHHEASLRGPSVIRTCVPWFPGFTEGWAHYVEELAIERGLAEGRPLVEVAQLRYALEAATRLLIHLSVHLGQWTFAEAVERAVQLCGWPPDRAVREVLVVVSDPSGAMYTLGKLRIRQWRRSPAVAGGPDQLRHFHDRLLRCGNAPLSTAWQYYLDGQRDRQPPVAPSYSGAAR